MTRKGRAITLSLQEPDKERLKAIAADFGMTWGDKPNISKLIEAIARGKLRVSPNHNWSSERIDTLNRVRKLLMDAGERELALAIAHLLLERSELSIPLRSDIEQFVSEPAHPWRIQVDQFIKRHQPFQLAYQDAADQLWHFSIRHGAIIRHGDRDYLDCWCDETAGNQDIDELCHNWCLRLDRIADDAMVSGIGGTWRSQLDFVPVELHLYRGLAIAYESKTSADLENGWHPDFPQVRRVVRKMTHSFWLFREIRRYGADCVVVAPPEVRDRFHQELIRMVSHYQSPS